MVQPVAEHARGGEDVAHYWLSILEMRAAVATDVARLCAERGSRAVKEELTAIATRMSKATSDEDLFALEVRFWERMLDGADNIPYRLAFNSMVKSVRVMGAAAQKWSVQEVRNSGYRAATAAAVAAGNAAKAETVTREAMRQSVEAFAKHLPARNGSPVKPATRPRKPSAPAGGTETLVALARRRPSKP